MNVAGYKTVAVIDIGKTNAKVVVLDAATGAEIAVRRTPNRVIAGPPYPHYDIEGLWCFIVSSLAAFSNGPGYDAISITTHGASAVLVDAQGNLAMPVLDYEFEYPQRIQDAYGALRSDFLETCSPALPAGLNLGAQIHFQKTVFANAFANVSAILTYPQYWAYRLSGVMANEATSLGCHTDLWNPAAGDYSSLVDRLDIRALMAPVRSAFDALGSLRTELCAAFGLSEPVPVFCGIHDSNASLLPHLIQRQAPFAVVSTGTWVVCFATPGNLDRLDPTRDCLANVDAFGKPVPSARFMGGREFEMLTQGLAPPDGDLDEAVREVVAKSLMLLPNVVEGSGPFPGKTMHWTGEPASDAERLAVASLYMAMMTDACLALAGAAGPIIVEGPMSRNSVFLQALASVTQRDVVAQAEGSLSGTALGAALLTGIAVPTVRENRIQPSAGLSDYWQKWKTAADTAR